MNALNNLTFMISLIDKVSGPMGKVMTSIDRASAGFSAGAQKIGYGVAGLAGAAYSVNNLLEPTKAMQRALGEVKSLGVADDTLDKLRVTALKFSAQYGDSAADVVRASYDIQSAISGLTGDELSAFTSVSGVLAKGTKANVADITNYVGTMYGIFKQNADAMGKAKWIEEMAAQTAMAVNIFKSDGKNMASAFTAIGASAQNFGISMAEQFAVLGQLQATMSGSEAGTKYRAFLDNVGKAQKVLNLQFTDAQDRMLPIVDILGKINEKFGAIDTVAEADLLKKAFGTDEAVALIKLLNNDLTGLQQNIADISKQTGMDEINKMAEAMTDPWAKMKTGVDAISVSIGTKLLPILLPTIAAVNSATQSVFAWTDANPELSKWIGILTLGTFGFIGTLALFSIAAGYATIVSTGWGLAMTWIVNPIKSAALAIWGALPSIWAFTTALLANPITWWVLGIAAIVGVVAAAIIYWDEWTSAVAKFGSQLMDMFSEFSLVDKAISAWGTLKQWWNNFTAWLGTLNPWALLGDGLGLLIAGFEAVPQWWSDFTAWLASLPPFAVLTAGLGLLVAGFEAVPQWWSDFTAWLASLAPFAVLTAGLGLLVAGFEAVPKWWSDFTAWLVSLAPFAVLTAGLGLLMPWLEALPLWWSNFKAWIGTLNPFALVGDGLGLVIAGLEALPLWWTGFTAWLGTLHPWVLLGDGLGLLVAGFEAVSLWWSGFKAWLGTLNPFALVGDGLGLVMAGLEALPQWWSGFKAWIGTLNPFDLVGDGLGLMVAGFEAVPQWWTNFTAWISTLNPWALLGDGIGLLVAGFEAVPQWWNNFSVWLASLAPFSALTVGLGLLVAGFEAIPQWWTNFTAWMASLNPFAALSSAVGWLVNQFDAIKQWWAGFKGWLASLNPFAAIGNGIGRVLSSISSIPGLKLPSIAAAAAQPAIAPPPSLNKGPADERYRPGILKQIVNAQGNSNSVDVGGITVNNYGNKPVSGQMLADQLAMAAG
jgi:TP901 family phage tail tape measure protein